ncbi:unnamed protein product [Adineta steineri]|uniref:G-protein coupled receptors family 1 profile domain-containing protein n=1 Tax=Adineta steineri TaxID=433720 RepID=A0A814IJ53_9BILA|nr:unnamed protein product [Adineta steineri]CAF1024140.1 unnamed protein product [Adineta steineri]
MNEIAGIFSNNSSEINTELWFIPIDILTIVCVTIAIILSTIFFLIILFDKTCHTIPMMLVGNSCLIGILFGIMMLWSGLFTLVNDLKKIQYEDFFCSFRGYMGYVTCSIQNCSYLLQAIYRFLIIIYPTRLFFQTIRFQLFLICLSWIVGFLYPIYFLFTKEIIYNVNNQICQLKLHLSFSVIYMANGAYIIPVFSTIFVYFKLIRYVKQMSKRITPVNTLIRAQRELKMVRRTVILVTILFILCFPYAMFILLSFFLTIPKYHFRISYIFVDISFISVIIILFQFTDPLKTSVTKKFHRRAPMILPTIIQ